MLLSIFQVQVQGQTRQGLPTHIIPTDLNFTLGQTGKDANPAILGFEMNFWALPYFTLSGTQKIMRICNDTEISVYYNLGNASLGFKMEASGFSGIGLVPQIMSNLWINLNLRVYYGNYILLNGWQGNNWYEIAPHFKIQFTNDTLPLYNDTTFYIKETLSTLGASIADIRVYSLQNGSAWGQFLRHYLTPTPSKFNYTLTYVYFESKLAYQPSGPIFDYDFINITMPTFDVLRCAFYKGMQADGSCSQNCLTTKCLACQSIDKKYFNLCRYCDPLSTSCLAMTSCPTDYYNDNGICYKCPAGCSSCSSAVTCNTCDSGLILRNINHYQIVPFPNATNTTNCTNGTSGLNCTVTALSYVQTVCDCPDSQFGTYVSSLDTITCSKCDDTCNTCQNSSVYCTSCIAPRYLFGSLCISNCSDMQPDQYGENSTRACTTCPTNCSACTSPTGCTNCKNGTFNGTSLQYLNFAGICLNTCPLNSIPQLAQRLCNKCGSHCKSCTNTTNNCTACDTDYNLFVNNTIGSCIATCPLGYFPKNGICTKCDVSCVLCDAENFCTECTYNASDPLKQYYFVNYQCKLTCPDKYYPDSSNTSRIFCRNCPSNCLNCGGQTNCTVCLPTYYLSTQGSLTLCVLPQYCPQGQYANASAVPQRCLNCKTNCAICTGATDCQQCKDGYFLDPVTQNCLSSCPTTYYALANNTCSHCISNCDSCSDAYTCDTCSSTYYLQEGLKTCVSSCATGYYLNASISQCKICKPECTACSGASICSGCVIGYTLNGMTCVKNCGNGVRQSLEQCDDGNSINGDGCSSDCMIESGYVCQQASPKDLCRSNPEVISAQWADSWGSIVLKFASSLYYYSINSTKSSNPYTFCSQILGSSIITQLGSYYECSLSITGDSSSQLQIDVGSDSTIGNNITKFNTSITLIDNSISMIGKTIGIPTYYIIQNLPLDTPYILFTLSSGTNTVGSCASDLTITLVNSKGLTKRNIKSTWTLITISPSDSTIQANIQANILNGCSDKLSCTIDKATIQTIGNKNLSIKAQVTNFLGQSGTNITTIQFLGTKKLEILDVPDMLNLPIQQVNQISPRFRFPYCSYDSTTNITLEQSSLTYTCEIYPTTNLNLKTSLTNCAIPANYMNISQTYYLRINASYPGYVALAQSKIVFIQSDSPPIQVAYIQGCNRKFHPDTTFSLTAVYNTLPSQTTFVWSCITPKIGSTCFSRNQQYISFGISETINISANIFNYEWSYQFTVVAFDKVSKTNSTLSCIMEASLKTDNILDLIIVSEQSNTGYIDYSRKKNSFKVYILNLKQANQSALTYSWKISDSNGQAFSQSDMSIYQNSVGIMTTQLSKNQQYKLTAEVTDGIYLGSVAQIFKTQPDISNEFRVEPDYGNALETIFTLQVSSQITFEGLNQYVYGYIDPSDGITQIAVTQKTYEKFQTITLPQPPNGVSSLVCYVDVIQPNRLSKTYTKTITINPTSLTTSTFNNQVSNAVMDDLIESMQIKNKLATLNSLMSVSEKSAAIKKILQGLQGETTSLSDYYIQASVASLLEYISTQSDSLNADGSIVTQAASIFTQITITENKLVNDGKYSQFTKAATNQLDMKTNLMKGLKNILKGSLSNQILGDLGGFAYQGQNIYAKAVKFDSLESTYQVNVKLPISVDGTLSQNYVGITLPGAGSSSNPCKNYPACQVSVIILDSPVNPFISNSKESKLKSIFVDISIQSTEVASPNTYVAIQDLSVTGLTDPITISVPLLTALDTSNPNRTLGCGYLDETDQIFKSEGIKIQKTSNSLVQCLASHLTAIGVEEYTSDVTADESDADSIADIPISEEEKQGKEVNMWNSWAIYVCIVLLILLALGTLWTYRKDKRDQLNYSTLRSDKEKIYLGVFLDPIVYVRKEEKQDTEKLVKTTHQLEKEQKMKPSKTEQQYEQIDINPNDTMRVSMLLPPPSPQVQQQQPPVNTLAPPLQQPLVLEPQQNQADFFAVDDDDGMSIAGLSKKSKKTVKKKKKKKKGSAYGGASARDAEDQFEETNNNFRQNGMFGASNNRQPINDNQQQQQEHNIFFEGGEIEEDEIVFGVEFEGGSEEEGMDITGGIDAAAESIKSRRSKKKAKKKRGTSSRRGSVGAFSNGNHTDGEDAQVEDIDEGEKSARSNKSGRSTGGKKKKKKGATKQKSTNQSQNFPRPASAVDEDGIKFNSQLGAGGFGMRRDPTDLFQEEEQLPKQEDMRNTGKSGKSGKGKKKKKKGSRAGSRASSRSSNDSGDGNGFNKPDFEAEEIIHSKRRNQMELTNKSDLLKPISSNRSKKPKVDNALDATADRHNLQQNLNQGAGQQHDTKGFDTLMAADDFNQNQPVNNLEGVNKVSTKKPVKRSKTAHGGVVRPRRFQKEQAGCCVFYCWNCKESHRLCALYRHYNEYLSRSARLLILIMSLFMFIMISGFMIDGSQLTGNKDTRGEQFACGLVTAIITKIWIVILSNLMRHTPRDKIYLENYNSTRARRLVKFNQIRFWVGVGLAGLTISWGWAFLFAIIGDFVFVEGFILIVQTITTLIVGSAPDACGKCRNYWLETLLQSIKDTVK